MSFCDLKHDTLLCAYHVSNRLGRGQVLHYGIPRYQWIIAGYSPEDELQEIYFLLGRSAFGEWYCFSVVGEAVQGLGLSLLSPRGAVGEKRSEIAVE